MDKVKLAIVDDHKLFRDGLAELIDGFSDYKVIIEADNGNDFIQQLPVKGIPDIILLDINMKEMDGFETAEWIKAHHPEMKVLVLSMYENENAIIRMLKAGARGYVLKDIRKKELEQALSSLVSKGYYYTEMVTGKLIHAINTLDDAKPGQSLKDLVSMNPREIEFLKLACTELTYKDIAEKMNLSIHTIDGYRDALFEKLNVKNRVGLVLYAIKNKIVLLE
ncbi:MAG: response regulator transcription factor [Bacteroidota bacterium]|nr:response regulator transcription factor [Bacteroidota bacterium]